MAKETYIKFRCSEKFKDMVEFQAKEHERTVSSYIEYLIRKDVDTMKITLNEWFTEEIEKELKAEKTCYPSEDGNWWLFTDMDVYDRISKKYRFDEELEERDGYRIWYENIEGYIKLQYEGEYVDCLGVSVYMGDYAEITAEVFEDNPGLLCNDRWDKVIEEHLKAQIMTGIKVELIDSLVNMIQEGYDLFELKSAIEMAEYKVKQEEE